MKKLEELKNIVFERFEGRRVEIIKKRNRFQQELDQDLHQFREAYGDEAINHLGDFFLVLVPSKKKRQEPTETTSQTQQPLPQSKQPRRRGKSIAAGRVDWIEAITAALKDVNKGLTKLQIRRKIVKQGTPKAKFKGAAFRRALSNLVYKSLITIKDGAYCLK